MSGGLRKAAARTLRRCANRLDPQKPVVVVNQFFSTPTTAAADVSRVRWNIEQGGR